MINIYIPFGKSEGRALPRRRCFHRKPGPVRLSKQQCSGFLHDTRTLCELKGNKCSRRVCLGQGDPRAYRVALPWISMGSKIPFILGATAILSNGGEASPTAQLDPTVTCLDGGELGLRAREDAHAPPIYPLPSLRQPTAARHFSLYAPSV